MPDAVGGGDELGRSPETKKANPTFEELISAMSAQTKAIDRLLAANIAPATGNKVLERLLTSWTSGIFFMIVGSMFLLIAYRGIGTTHPSMSFLLAVVGVAILLFGTGTQGVGNLGSEEANARYRVGLAGGAGVLAFCIAYGIAMSGERMKSFFAEEKRYVRVTLAGDGRDGQSTLADYTADVTLVGTPLPSLRHGNQIEVLVPYIVTDSAETKVSLQVSLKLIDPDKNKQLYPTFEFDPPDLVFSRDTVEHFDGGYELPSYKEPVLVKVSRSVNEQAPIDFDTNKPITGPNPTKAVDPVLLPQGGS